MDELILEIVTVETQDDIEEVLSIAAHVLSDLDRQIIIAFKKGDQSIKAVVEAYSDDGSKSISIRYLLKRKRSRLNFESISRSCLIYFICGELDIDWSNTSGVAETTLEALRRHFGRLLD